MKFFNNLPKITFTTSIGNFLISDFFTYIDITKKQIDKNSISVDDKTTLIEASYQTYTDTNNFWTFLSANQTINPFDLLTINAFLFSKNNSDKINLILLPSPGAITGGTAFPIGSIIVPAIGNTGASYTFGYTGNYNINGQFALIENTSYYDGNMLIGTQYGGTGPFINVTGTAENVTVLQKNNDGTFTWAGTYYTENKKLYSNKILSQVLEYDAKVIDKESTSSNPTLDTYLPASTPLLGITSPVLYTTLQTVKNKSKQVQAFVPSQLGTLQSSFVAAKYN
jgi:hypothetical protein